MPHALYFGAELDDQSLVPLGTARLGATRFEDWFQPIQTPDLRKGIAMLKTYRGSCHCGAVKYEVELDLAAGTGRCNCSICAKRRSWGAVVKPEAFKLLSGEESLSDYQFGSKQAHHKFCRRCGIASFGHGYIEEIGGAYYSVNIACLDDVDPTELASAPVQYMNGRDNDWFSPPAETRHL